METATYIFQFGPKILDFSGYSRQRRVRAARLGRYTRCIRDSEPSTICLRELGIAGGKAAGDA